MIGERRHLREVGHHDDLSLIGERRQGPTDVGRRGPPDAGVDFVEHHRGRSCRQRQVHRQHGTRAHHRTAIHASGCAGSIQCEEQLDIVAGDIPSTADGVLPRGTDGHQHTCVGHPQRS